MEPLHGAADRGLCYPSYYGGTESVDNAANDYVTLAFTGTQVAYYAVKGSSRGMAGVSIDGGAETSVDLYAASVQGNLPVYSATGLTNGTHTFKIRVTGTHNASSSGYYVTVDRVDITTPGAAMVLSTPTQSTAYDGEGNVVQETDGKGDATVSSYDPLGRLVSQTNPVSGTSLMTYTAEELTAQQDPAGNVTGYGYDAAGRTVAQVNPMTGTVQSTYDAAGNTVAMMTTDRTAGATAVTLDQMGYDALNRVITDTVVTDTANIAGSALTTLTRYDQDGNVAQTQQPNGDVVYNTYDAADRLQNVEIDPQSVSKGGANPNKYESYGYDAAGNVTAFMDADGRTTTTGYDGDNRATQSVAVSYPPTGTTTITTTTGYDPNGAAVAATTQTSDSAGAGAGAVQTHTTANAYNAADWETSTTNDGLTTSYSYDAAGQPVGEATGGGPALARSYDPAGRVTALTESMGGSGPYTARYTYTPNDLPKTAAYPNGTGLSVGYDANSALTQLAAYGPSVGPTQTLTTTDAYGYNAAGFMTSATTLSGTNTLMHDASGRLTSDCGPQVVTPDHCAHWTYDANDNLLTASDDSGATVVYTYTGAAAGASGTINAVQQMGTTGQAANSVVSYGYDNVGDVTRIANSIDPTNAALKGAVNQNLRYDAVGRPVQVTTYDHTIPTTFTFSYDAGGERVDYRIQQAATGLNQDFHFGYRGDGELAQVTVITGGVTLYTDTYLYDPQGQPLELLRQQSGVLSRYWYVLDGQGNVVALTDINGSVVDRYAYDQWGELTSNDGTDEHVAQQLRYHGAWYDEKLSWYWLETRYYDPETARFLQPDPSSLNGVHTYAYAADDPADLSDPTGLAFHVNETCDPSILQAHRILGHAICAAYAVFARNLNNDYATLFAGLKGASDQQSASVQERAGAVADIVLQVLPAGVGGKLSFVARHAAGPVLHLLQLVVRALHLHLPDAVLQAATSLIARGRQALKGIGCTACFAAGTLVATPNGAQPIQALHVGDTVLSENPATGVIQPEAVQVVIADPVSPLIAVDLVDGSAITVTADHPFWLDGGVLAPKAGWIQAGDLMLGDRLRTPTGTDAVVLGVRHGVGEAAVYTLTVAKDHTFFVGSAQVLVHNLSHCGLSDAEVQDALNALTSNDYHHIFGKAAHNLDPLVTHLSSQRAVLEDIFRQINKNALPSAGAFVQIVTIGGTKVTVRGAVVNGIVRLGTVFA